MLNTKVLSDNHKITTHTYVMTYDNESDLGEGYWFSMLNKEFCCDEAAFIKSKESTAKGISSEKMCLLNISRFLGISEEQLNHEILPPTTG